MLILADQTVSLKSVADTFIPFMALMVTIFLFLVGIIAYFLKRLINQVDDVASELKPIRPAIVELQNLLTPAKLKKLMFPMTVAPGSPLKVTPYGDELLKNSGFYEILNSHADELVQMVKARKPSTNYDIQAASNEVITELMHDSSSILRPLKNFAFNNGLEIEALVPPAGVTLRDEVMKTLSFKDEERA